MTELNRVNELEQILGHWRSHLRIVGVDMDLGPESATSKILNLWNSSKDAPRLREKLAAYESQMRYRIEDCPRAIVVMKHGEQVCRCDTMEQAAEIAARLNRLSPENVN